jgi:hypothetical protein
MTASNPTGNRETLPAGSARSLRLPRGETARLRCLDGRLWLTRAGDARDYVLEPGGAHFFEDRDRVVVQALESAAYSLEYSGESSSGPSGRGAAP